MDYVIFEGRFQMLLEVVNARRAREPHAKIAYYDLQPSASGPLGSFTLTPVHSVMFCPEGYTMLVDKPADDDEPAEGQKNPPASLQASAAASVPASVWQERSHVGLAFSVKWTAAGLTPVRPQVVSLSDFSIPPGRALQL